MTELINCEINSNSKPIDVISGGDSRDWDFSNPVAFNIGLPHAKLYKNKAPIGADMDGKLVLPVADLNNMGSSPRDLWLPQIINGGGIAKDILFFVDRMEDGVEEMEKLGLNRYAVISLDPSAWQLLLDSGKVDSKTYQSMNERLENKQAWAHNMLLNNTSKLKDILDESSTFGKGVKILNVGYPEIKDELVGRLTSLGYTGKFE